MQTEPKWAEEQPRKRMPYERFINRTTAPRIAFCETVKGQGDKVLSLGRFMPVREDGQHE